MTAGAEQTDRSAGLTRLLLPLRENFASEAAWRRQVQLVVQRAHDCARYLEAQACAATGGRWSPALAARRAAQADAARLRFEHLHVQAERVTGREAPIHPAPQMPVSGRLRSGALVIDLDAGEVRDGGRAVHLTDHERGCLVALVANRGRVVTREAMLHLVSGDAPMVEHNSRAIDVHLAHLRAKVSRPEQFETIPGIGFRLGSGTPAASLAGPEGFRSERAAPRHRAARHRGPLRELALPRRTHYADAASWHEAVRLLVQRAHDRVTFLEGQIRVTERLPGPEGGALAARRTAQAAHARERLSELAAEAEPILGEMPSPSPPPPLPVDGELQVGDLLVDIDAGEVLRDGRVLQITEYERMLVVALVANLGRVISREALLIYVRGDDPLVELSSRSINLHICEVRARLGPDLDIETVRGLGVRLRLREGQLRGTRTGVG